MKRLLALLLAAVMCLSLAACGNRSDSETQPNEAGNTSGAKENNTLDKNDKENYLGVWETETDEGTKHFRLTLNKGGVGKYENLLNNGEGYDLSWEVTDETLITEISFMGMEHKAVLELDDGASCLNIIQNGFPVYSQTETVFVKQP